MYARNSIKCITSVRDLCSLTEINRIIIIPKIDIVDIL